MLFHAFRKFRNNVDLMTTRVAASYLNLAFGHVLGRVEQLTGKQPDRRRFTSAASNDLRVDREAGGALQVRVYLLFSYPRTVRAIRGLTSRVLFKRLTGITSSTATRG